MAQYTMKYGDLIDAGIITRAELPKAWAGFPSLVLPIEGEIDFYEVMYRRYADREIGGDTPAVFLRFLNDETLNLLEMLPDGIYSNVLRDMITDASEETRTLGGTDSNNISRSSSGSTTHTGTNKQTTTGTVQGNETVIVDSDGTRGATTNGTQTTNATTTANRNTTQRAAPNGVVSLAYSTGGETATDSDTTDTTTTTNATENVTTTDDSTTTKTSTNTNNGSVTGVIDEKDTTSDSGTETATRQHSTTESVKRSGAQSGDMARAYAILRDGKPLVMWIADRYNSCFMGVY